MAAQAIMYGGMAGLELVGGYYAAQNVKETAALNRDISEMNAQFAELDALDAIAEGYTQIARYQSVVDSTLADQQVALTAQDVDVNYGTAAAIQEETRFMADLNRMEIQKQYEEQALGYRKQSRDFLMQGRLQYNQAMSKASAIKFGAVTGAAKTGISGYERSL